MTEHITITATTGVRWNVHILNKGDRYGRSGALVWESEKPGVEFYDSRYPHTDLGQFVSRYHVDTILEGTSGLNLNMAITDWSIDKAAMDVVRAWLRQETAAKGGGVSA